MTTERPDIKVDIRNPRARRSSIFRRTSDFPSQNLSHLESAPKQHDQFQCLRNFLKIPRENRIWGTSEVREYAKECLDLLAKVYLLDRLDEENLQKILMVCELVVMRKPQILFEAGQEQTEAFWLISGNLVMKNGSVPGVSEQNDTGNSLPSLNPGDTIGFKALFSDWKPWPISCMAGTNKVELVVIKKQDAVRLHQALWVAFDSKSAVDQIQSRAQVLTVQRRRPSESSRPASAALSHRSVTPRGEAEVESSKLQNNFLPSLSPSPAPSSLGMSAALRGIPFFRQFRAAFLHRIFPSMRLEYRNQRSILFRHQLYISDAKAGSAHDDRSAFLGSLHVVTTGRLWVFHRVFKDKDNNRPQKLYEENEVKEIGSLDALWERPSDFCHVFGSFHSVHYPGNAIFGPYLPSDCTIIADAGTMLIQVPEWERHLLNLKDTVFVYQCESVRRILISPHHARSQLDRSTLMTLLQDGLKFFQHIAAKHTSKLLETCSVRKFFAGDKLIIRGEHADCLYIVLNGFAEEYLSAELSTHDGVRAFKDPPQPVIWSAKERTNAWTLSQAGERGRKLYGVGDTIGEREVIERGTYGSTVIADEEIEVIEIRQEVYETVLWDLCDGQAVSIELIEEILSCEPSQRDSCDSQKLVEILESSDFLQQFPRELQRHLTASMSIVRFEPNSIIVVEGDMGTDMYIIVSGSAALHSRKEVTYGHSVSIAAEKHEGGSARAEKDFSQYGRCTRVLGIGDSFGETAFLHVKEHLATAITRTNAVMIKVSRNLLSKVVWQQLSEFVGTPPAEALNRVFAKELEDRNENDTMLLVNSLTVNPFFKKMSYQALIECAQSFRRTDARSKNQIEIASEIKMIDDTVYVVNRGSLLASSTEYGPVFLQPVCFGSQSSSDLLKSRQRPMVDGKAQTRGRQRSPQLWKTMQLESQYYGLFVVIKLLEGIRMESHLLNVAVRLMARYSMVTIDSVGTLAFLNEQEFQEIGLIRDISKCWRQPIVGFRFALAVAIASETVIFATNSVKDGKKFMDTLCSLSLFLKEHYVRNTVLKCGCMWLRLGSDLKILNFFLSETGKLSYNALKDASPLTDKGWFDLCEMSECSEISFLTIQWKDTERLGLEITISPDARVSYSSPAAKVSLFFQTQKERDQWADILCLCAPASAHRNLYAAIQIETEQYEEAVRKIQGAIVRFIKWIVTTREKAYTRMFMSETEKMYILGEDRNKSAVFIGYGSAFVLNGSCRENEGSEVLYVSLLEWSLIERREHLRQLDTLTRFLERLPAIKAATKKDLAALSSSATVARYSRGDTIQISTFNDKHIALIQDGVCTLGRVPKRASRTFKLGREISRTKCSDCNGIGSVASYKITEKVHICPFCKGLGFVVDLVLNHPPNELLLLHAGAVLSELLTEGESSSDFELRANSALTLIFLRKDLWDEIRDRRMGADAKSTSTEKMNVAADFGARHFSKSQIVLKTIERDRHTATALIEHKTAGTSTSAQERGSSAPEVVKATAFWPVSKYRSKESKKISTILGGTIGRGGAAHSSREGESVQSSACAGQGRLLALQSVGTATTIAMPPPATVKNRFAPTSSQPQAVPKFLDSDLRSALLKSFLDTARDQTSAKMQKQATTRPIGGAQTARGDLGKTGVSSNFGTGFFLTSMDQLSALVIDQQLQSSKVSVDTQQLGVEQGDGACNGQAGKGFDEPVLVNEDNSLPSIEQLRAELGRPGLFANISPVKDKVSIKLGEYLAELRSQGLVDDGGTNHSGLASQQLGPGRPARNAVGVAEAVESFDEGVRALDGSTGTEEGLSARGLCHALTAVSRRRMLPATPPPCRTILVPTIPPPVLRSPDERARHPPFVPHRIVGTPRAFAAAYRRKQKVVNQVDIETRDKEMEIWANSQRAKPSFYERREPWRSPFVERLGAGASTPQPHLRLPLPTVRRL